ncbi:hypothetical protein [Erythrobacter aureus]|uniref:hypothetical protein n=1 Tax=Erythrobacter aureus TaxID=2182384 RepID=UPI003A915C6F
MRYIFAPIALVLAHTATVANATPPAIDWEIGPIIRGQNYSVNMPLTPMPTKDGWAFDFPFATKAEGHVHYVTFDPGSLGGASEIKVRFRVDAREGTRFVPQEHPHLPGTVSLFFQRRGDNWSAKGRYALYRWYAPAHTVQEIAPGVHEMTARLDDPLWGSVVGGMKSGGRPRAFETALANANRVGLVFGSTAARGHGVYATAPARFELLDFEIR